MSWARAATLLLLISCAGEHPTDHAAPIDLRAGVLTRFTPDSSGQLPIALAENSAGNVWTLAQSAPFLSIYSADGRFVRSFGDSGGGPAELMEPLGLVATGDTAVIWDNIKRWILRVDSAGRPIDALHPTLSTGAMWHSLPQVSYGRPGQFRALGNGWVLATYTRPPRVTRDLNAAIVVLADSTGEVSDTLLKGVLDSTTLAAQIGPAVQLVPVPLWTTCGSSHFVSYRPVAGVVTRSDAAGRVLRVDTVSAEWPALTEAAIRRNIVFNLRRLFAHRPEPSAAQMHAMVNSVIDQSKANETYPSRGPAFVDLLCDRRGRVWLDRFSLTDSPIGYGQHWLVVDSAGHHREAILPAGFRLLEFGRSGALGYVVDSTGVVQVARLNIPDDNTEQAELPRIRPLAGVDRALRLADHPPGR